MLGGLGAPTTLVQSDQRPVPLEFEYSTTQLQEKVAELNEQGRSPVYLVHFTQNACAGTARDLLSTNFCTKEEKHAIAQGIGPLKNRLHLTVRCANLTPWIQPLHRRNCRSKTASPRWNSKWPTFFARTRSLPNLLRKIGSKP